MKAKHLILSLLFMFALNAQAQQQRLPRPEMEEMHNIKWEEISTKSNLSEKEKTAVRPVFLEYENAVWNVSKQSREMFKAVRDKKEGAALNYEEINNKYIEQETKLADLLKQYHTKLSKILPPETLYNYYRAERHYKRQLLQSMPERSKK